MAGTPKVSLGARGGICQVRDKVTGRICRSLCMRWDVLKKHLKDQHGISADDARLPVFGKPRRGKATLASEQPDSESEVMWAESFPEPEVMLETEVEDEVQEEEEEEQQVEQGREQQDQEEQDNLVQTTLDQTVRRADRGDRIDQGQDDKDVEGVDNNTRLNDTSDPRIDQVVLDIQADIDAMVGSDSDSNDDFDDTCLDETNNMVLPVSSCPPEAEARAAPEAEASEAPGAEACEAPDAGVDKDTDNQTYKDIRDYFENSSSDSQTDNDNNKHIDHHNQTDKDSNDNNNSNNQTDNDNNEDNNSNNQTDDDNSNTEENSKSDASYSNSVLQVSESVNDRRCYTPLNIGQHDADLSTFAPLDLGGNSEDDGDNDGMLVSSCAPETEASAALGEDNSFFEDMDTFDNNSIDNNNGDSEDNWEDLGHSRDSFQAEANVLSYVPVAEANQAQLLNSVDAEAHDAPVAEADETEEDSDSVSHISASVDDEGRCDPLNFDDFEIVRDTSVLNATGDELGKVVLSKERASRPKKRTPLVSPKAKRARRDSSSSQESGRGSPTARSLSPKQSRET